MLPQLNQPSYILNSEWVSMFYLSLRCSVLNNANKIQLLYSNLLDASSFELIYQRVLEFRFPILVVCLTEEKYGNTVRQFAYGAVTNVPLRDLGEKQGCAEDSVFQILPNYKVYFTKPKSSIQAKFAYFSRSGLGFGSTANGKFRIWVDGQDIIKKSYCLDSDEVYEEGPLLPPQVKNQQVSQLTFTLLAQSHRNLGAGSPQEEVQEEPVHRGRRDRVQLPLQPIVRDAALII